MASLRALMNCMAVDTSGNNSVLRDFFGFLRARVPTDPDNTVIAEVSMLRHVRGLQGRHFHLNIVQVGFDLLANIDNGWEMLDYCTYRTRNIYRTRGLGLGRVLHFELLSANARGYDSIGSNAEARDMWEDFGVTNDGIDAFVVRTRNSGFSGGGLSPINGDCSNGTDDDGNWAGDVSTRSFEGLSRTFAHEIGHYLSLPHNHPDGGCPSTNAGRNRLMAQTGCVISVRDSVILTSDEGGDARGHCIVKAGC